MRRLLCVILIPALLFSLTACQSEEPVSHTGFALDTVVSVTIYDCEENVERQTLLNRCFDEINRLEGLFSATIESSDISHINAANGAPITVSDETAELLRLCLRYAELSDGAFDVTLRAVTALWDFSSETLPDAAQLAAAAATVDYRQLTVAGNTVTLSGGALDLGGVAKGYIADRVAALLREGGATSAMIDLGGNIVVIGERDGRAWNIGIKDPNNVSELCAVVTGCDLSVVTSGIYERGFTLNGVRYHHLLSPESGMPVQNGLASVSIVCENSAQADALSTACFVLGEEKGLSLIESLDGVEGLFVHQDGTLRASSGLSYTTA